MAPGPPPGAEELVRLGISEMTEEHIHEFWGDIRVDKQV